MSCIEGCQKTTPFLGRSNKHGKVDKTPDYILQAKSGRAARAIITRIRTQIAALFPAQASGGSCNEPKERYPAGRQEPLSEG